MLFKMVHTKQDVCNVLASSQKCYFYEQGVRPAGTNRLNLFSRHSDTDGTTEREYIDLWSCSAQQRHSLLPATSLFAAADGGAKSVYLQTIQVTIQTEIHDNSHNYT